MWLHDYSGSSKDKRVENLGEVSKRIIVESADLLLCEYGLQALVLWRLECEGDCTSPDVLKDVPIVKEPQLTQLDYWVWISLDLPDYLMVGEEEQVLNHPQTLYLELLYIERLALTVIKDSPIVIGEHSLEFSLLLLESRPSLVVDQHIGHLLSRYSLQFGGQSILLHKRGDWDNSHLQ